MLNMLIAMMGKSFDVIWESAAATYLAGFAQTALTYASLPAAPHPFSVLSLPYQAQYALRRVLRGGACLRPAQPELAYALLRTNSSESAGAHAEAGDGSHMAAAEQQQRMLGQRMREQQQQLLEVMQEYVMEHEDDVAEEERWRTKMHKAFMERSHKLEGRLDALHAQVGSLQGLPRIPSPSLGKAASADSVEDGVAARKRKGEGGAALRGYSEFELKA